MEAHHSMMARRARLGLPQIGYASPVVGQEYTALNSWSGLYLNILIGMSYSGKGDTKCFEASESVIVALDTASDLFKKIYIPAIWSEIMIQA